MCAKMVRQAALIRMQIVRAQIHRKSQMDNRQPWVPNILFRVTKLQADRVPPQQLTR